MKPLKIIIPLATIVLAVMSPKFLKNKNIAKTVLNPVENIDNIPEKIFAGIPQSKIDELVNNTFRGIKATIDGNTLTYIYESASGKTKNSAEIIIDSKDKINVFLGNGSQFQSKSPRFFAESLKKMIK